MEDVLKQIVQLKEKANNHREEVAKSIDIQPHEIPAGVFGMIFNHLTLGLELLSHYCDAWRKTTNTNTITTAAPIEIHNHNMKN